jgi:hypothetical protein
MKSHWPFLTADGSSRWPLAKEKWTVELKLKLKGFQLCAHCELCVKLFFLCVPLQR